MRKLTIWMMVAILTLCGTAMFTSCSNDDNPVTPDLNVAEKIIGKWMPADKDGQAMQTNKKMAITFVTSTKAYMSASLSSHPEAGTFWGVLLEGDVVISGNKLIVTAQPDEHKTLVHNFTITDINDKEFKAKHEVTYTIDNNVVLSIEDEVRYVKVSADYSEAVLGLWECTGLTGIETYNDANARLEFLADGTYRYYRMDEAGQWQTVTSRDIQDYFVDGTLLATRWKNQSEQELREWWEIASLSGNQMTWTALRQNADGTTFKQEMTWKRIDLNVAEKIIGRWIFDERNGEPTPTDKKRVFNFVSPTKAYISASRGAGPTMSMIWFDHTEADVAIDGNKVTLTMQTAEQTTVEDALIITDISDTEFTALLKVTVTTDGNVERVSENVLRYVKVPANYSADVLGLWECEALTSDDKNERLEFLADGTYRFYRQAEAGQWEEVTSCDYQNYFVDGTLLATRWKKSGEEEQRVWWEIESISGGEMVWTALRQNADGSTFKQEMTWKRIELNVAEKIIGKWQIADIDGKPALTKSGMVINFVSTTKAYVSASRNSQSTSGLWADKIEADVVINGNDVTVIFHPDENKTSIHMFNVTAINATEFTADQNVLVSNDGNVEHTVDNSVRFVKTTADYSVDILTLWECVGVTTDEMYSEVDVRLWFFADGTYNFWRKNEADEWESVIDIREFQDYFVDGSLVCTRWKNPGEGEEREWWKIASISGDEMVWTALRQNFDGSIFKQEIKWKKVGPIVGKAQPETL